ncbi:MAG: peptide chain release factor N(5)-glutamine methyltransferase [Lachnospiraceae bacterium]
MTLEEAYSYGRKKLEEAKIEDASIDAWYLLEQETGIDRATYYLRLQESLSIEQEESYLLNLQSRALHMPLQHITGIQEFMGLEFQVNEHVLIPRQDTEVLVEEVLKKLQPKMKVLDMCTGSGCILISLLVHQCNTRGVGVDISTKALEVAVSNAKRYHITKEKATFIQSDLFQKVSGTYDVIVSNPPYIQTSALLELAEEVRCHEPQIALDGKEDGLYFYRQILQEAKKYLNQSGWLFLEIGYNQGKAVSCLMKEQGYTSITVKKDLTGLDRVVFGMYNI